MILLHYLVFILLLQLHAVLAAEDRCRHGRLWEDGLCLEWNPKQTHVIVQLPRSSMTKIEEFVSLYAKYRGQQAPKSIAFYSAFSFFRGAAILQGVAKRAQLGYILFKSGSFC